MSLSIYQKHWREKCIHLCWLTTCYLCYYSNNTPEIHRKTVQHSFHSLQKSFLIYKRKATSVSSCKEGSLFSILPQSPGLLFLQSSCTIPFRWNNSLQTKVLRSHVYRVVYNMSFQWGFFQSWQRLQKVAIRGLKKVSARVLFRVALIAVIMPHLQWLIVIWDSLPVFLHCKGWQHATNCRWMTWKIQHMKEEHDDNQKTWLFIKIDGISVEEISNVLYTLQRNQLPVPFHSK